MGNPTANPTMNACPPNSGQNRGTSARPSSMVTTQPLRRPGSNSTSTSSPPPRRQGSPSPPPRRQGNTSPISSASTPRQTWTRPTTAGNTGWGTNTNNTWYRPRERSRSQSPQSPQGWTTVSRPGSPNWGWGG